VPNREKWADDIGEFWYLSLVLSDFNPTEALRVYDNPAHIIAQAWVSKQAFNYIEPQRR
jgi:hypothetical protein